ncbi:MAG: hypothetical protein M1826_000163 [Phylliscum demangeonii]|nr:MAG: hypothetical protein M1826_000163 [Phylliscum demangeonii]
MAPSTVSAALLSLLLLSSSSSAASGADPSRDPLWTWESGRNPNQVMTVTSRTHPGDWNEYQPNAALRFADPENDHNDHGASRGWKSFGVCMASQYWELEEQQCLWPHARQLQHCVSLFARSAAPATAPEIARAHAFQPYWDGVARCVYLSSTPAWRLVTGRSCRPQEFMAEKWEDFQKCHSDNERWLPESIVLRRTIDVGEGLGQGLGEGPAPRDERGPGPASFSREVRGAAVSAERRWWGRVGRVVLGRRMRAVPPPRGSALRRPSVWLKEVEGAVLETP